MLRSFWEWCRSLLVGMATRWTWSITLGGRISWWKWGWTTPHPCSFCQPARRVGSSCGWLGQEASGLDDLCLKAWRACVSVSQSVKSVFYFMSVQNKVILRKEETWWLEWMICAWMHGKHVSVSLSQLHQYFYFTSLHSKVIILEEEKRERKHIYI